MRVVEIILLSELSATQKENVFADYSEFDVLVRLDSQETYRASFYTLEDLIAIRTSCKEKGENLGGMYFWSNSMILIERRDKSLIRRVIEELMEKGDFFESFEKIQ